MNQHKIFIIILNWNGKVDTLECLESVSCIDYPNFHIVVVDNGSSDDSVRVIKSQFPEVILLKTGENLGFAGGNNVGMRYALDNGADYILLLNNDTIVDDQLLKNYVKAAESMIEGGIFGAKIYFHSEPNTIWYAGGKWDKKAQNFQHVGINSVDNGSTFNMIAETDYACGCSLFVKKEVLNKIGLLDEKFFLIFEETDFCYRARKAGYKCFFIPDAKVWHKISKSFGGKNSALYHYFHMRNKLLWAEKNLSFYEKLRLYNNVIYENVRNIFFPDINIANESFKEIFKSISEYKKILNDRYNNPINRARIMGIKDYCLRCFGDSTHAVKSLGKSNIEKGT